MNNLNFVDKMPYNMINAKTFRLWDNIVGWAVFAIATLSYWATMEPSTSLWDCSEFIATSYKLEVGHPPGAPLYMMLARIASLFASSPEDVAMMINGMNSLASGFTILFMFWTITHLARRIVKPGVWGMAPHQAILVLGSGVVGALSYAYTDTFWFSAVEGEVYALSSMFTALVVWLMFKWEENADSPTALRWIILIAYLMGLSIGVHILNLLTIPALVMIFFFRRYRYQGQWPVWKYMLMIAGALLTSMLILGVINGVIIPYTVALGAHFDTLMVNTFDLPKNVGMLIYVFLVFAILGTLIFTTHKRGKRILNVILLCITVVLIGFSSYAMMTVRASANPPMNSNDPSNPHMLLSVLNRDQYGARPLISGVYYDAQPLPMVESKSPEETTDANGHTYVDLYDPTEGAKNVVTMWYNPNTRRYQERVVDYEPVYPEEAYHYFPRMWYFARRADYAPFVDSVKTVSVDRYGETLTWTEPTRGDDLSFFMSYQMGDMFWRYFMWNFVGRQDDVQLEKSAVDGGIYIHGGWLSGINFIDEYVCGPQDALPADMQNNPARNTYFFLPLLLGLLGMIYHLVRDWRNWFVVMLMFLMMGVALVVYFNTAPNEPRERDYVYAGAFYAFSIWIGLGVLGIGELFDMGFGERTKQNLRCLFASFALLFALMVPGVLAFENWDDHDRSDRYYARDIGWNYLNSVPENGIIINYGDNDTFPLWYCQEVEGVRPDVKVMNLSYLEAEWYIDQVKLASNSAEGVPFTIPQEKYTLSSPHVHISAHPMEYVTEASLEAMCPEEMRLCDSLETKVYTFEYNYGMEYKVEKMLMSEATDKLLEYNKNFGDDVDWERLNEEQKQLMFLGQAIYRNDTFWDDYTRYTEAMEAIDYKLSLCYPYSLPLADAIALYISDEPMWMLADDNYERYRIVEVGSSIPEGFEFLTTVQPKVDHCIVGTPDDYIMGAVEYTIPVDKEAVLMSGLVDQKFADDIVNEVYVTLPRYYMSRGALMMYDLIANSNWTRPLSFTSTLSLEELGIQDYVRLDGYSYTFVPIYTKYDKYSMNVGHLDIDKLYPMFMDECAPNALNQAYRFGNVADDDVLADYFVRHNIETTNIRLHFVRVANGFIARAKSLLEPLAYGDDTLSSEDVSRIVDEAMENFEKAERLLDRGLEQLPPSKLGYRYTSVMQYINCYYRIGGELLKIGAMACVDPDMSKSITGHANDILVKGDDLNIHFIRHHAEWVNYYLEYLDRGMFDIDMATNISLRFENVCEGLNSAYHVDSYDIVSKSAFDFEGLANKYMYRLAEALPEGVESQVAAAVEQLKESNNGSYVYDHVAEEVKPLVKCIDNLCYYVYDMQGLPLDTLCKDSFSHLMVKSGFASAFGLPLESAQQPVDSTSAAKPAASNYELSKEVQEIVNIYGKGMESWRRATEHLKNFVDIAASRLGVAVTVERVDDFQYFYTYSDYAQQLLSMANSKGVSVADLVESLTLSDEAYALADEYLKMGDNRAMEYIAYCYDDMRDALQRMEHGEYSTKDATVVHVNMQEIVDVLNVSLVEAGSFDWVANPIVDSSLGYKQVSFDNLADRFFRIALNMADATDVEESANMLTVNVAVSIYSLVPSTRVNGNAEVDAIYVDNMRKYFEHSKVAAMVEQMYK